LERLKEKFSSFQNEELLGYTKKTPQSWTYSDEAIAIIQAYAEKYPQLFQQLAQTSHGSADNYFEADLFPTEIGEGRVNEMVKWVKSQPHSSAERRTCGTVTLEKEIVEELIEAVEVNKHNPIRQIILQVKPHLLYKANLTVSSTGPDPKADFHLFDRVTVASDSQIVPLGYKGTIVGIQRMVDLNPVRQERVRKEYVSFEILFDEEFVQGSTIYGIADKRMTKIAETNLINISYGLCE
jgi:5'-3' exoribonuclease 1